MDFLSGDVKETIMQLAVAAAAGTTKLQQGWREFRRSCSAGRWRGSSVLCC